MDDGARIDDQSGVLLVEADSKTGLAAVTSDTSWPGCGYTAFTGLDSYHRSVLCRWFLLSPGSSS